MDSLDLMLALVTATGALGLTAMSLVDALKTLPWGGVSWIGFPFLTRVIDPLKAPLAAAMGEDWRKIILAHWINGRPRSEQIGVIRSMIRLGLNAETAPELARFGGVGAAELTVVAEKLRTGQDLEQADVNLIGRLEASIEARLDGAFDRAEQAYRNWSRLLAGVVAVILAVVVQKIMADSGLPKGDLGPFVDSDRAVWAAVVVGLLAVPVAPIAKDLVSALTAASKALQTARRL
ncbi:hypothetical protein [Caulobacter henricii]|uniref:Uncharacterized protein n=1 Tax=Caulobacter henricii TaxID=69395 RepID=A0A0P0NX57_9CAUL|nr:hypothetical protein [Caulobacter henricii]ALL12182.1 hypothetical protein AQ619_01730 [Caulobacter henricii]